MAVCGSCGAPVQWVKTKAGKRMPLDVGASENGNITVTDGVAYYWPPGEGDRVSHFATCPNAAQHRKR